MDPFHPSPHPPRPTDLYRAETTLPGIGRKTANVVLGTAYGVPSIVVDTHVRRVANRLGLTGEDDPTKIEMDLRELLPPASWTHFTHRLIHHGRRICHARKPRCDECPLARLCPRIGVTDLAKSAT
jgi:endonuclease-3